MRLSPLRVPILLCLLMTTGLLLSPSTGGATTSERRAAAPALTARPATPLQGTQVAFRVKLPGQAKRPAVLERRVGSAWKRQAAKRSKPSGVVTFRVTAIGDTRWRVRARAITVKGKRLKAVVSKPRRLRPTPRAVLASATPAGRSPNRESGFVGISGDGRFVVFHSDARNLVPGYDGYLAGAAQVYLRDRVTGETTLVSAADADTVGNGSSIRPAISRDGEFVTFVSTASDLVAGDDNDRQDVFRWRRSNGSIILISEAGNGSGTDADSYDPSISGNGDLIAFSTTATNIDTDDDNGLPDVYVWDANTGESDRISASIVGADGNGWAGAPYIAADGRYVTFTSASSNLVLGDSNATTDLFRRDLDTDGLARVSVGATVTNADDYTSSFSSMSADGRFVAFASAADNLVPGGSPDSGTLNAFVRDMATGTTVLVSRARDGSATSGHSFSPGSVSDDGRLVVFSSLARDLVRGDTNGVADAFVWKRGAGADGTVSLVVRDRLWGPVDGAVYEPQLSADGRWFAFYSVASDLSPRDPNAMTDVYLWRR